MAFCHLLLSPDQFICGANVKGENVIQAFPKPWIPAGKRYLEASSHQKLR